MQAEKALWGHTGCFKKASLKFVEKLTPFKINPQKLVDTCGYELPTNLQNFTQKKT